MIVEWIRGEKRISDQQQNIKVLLKELTDMGRSLQHHCIQERKNTK
jgi:hypothetical protein